MVAASGMLKAWGVEEEKGEEKEKKQKRNVRVEDKEMGRE